MSDTIKATRYVGLRQVVVENVPKPQLEEKTDALVRVVRTCVCGSDLWWYREDNPEGAPHTCGHEAIGVVEEVASEVTDIHVGDFVIVPFAASCGKCPVCKAGFTGSCAHVVYFGSSSGLGCQSEYIRVPWADGTLVVIPQGEYTEEQLASFLTLSDVMSTGYHAAYTAEVKEGDTVVVIGDGAVGLSGVLAAKMMGAKSIIAMSRHEDRQKLAREFGATDIIAERGEEAVAKVRELTGGYGADAVLECVGSELSLDTAYQVARNGAIIGRVGVPHGVPESAASAWGRNIGLRGGPASVNFYDKKEGLLQAVLDGTINPGVVFTSSYTLDEIPQAYRDMDERKTTKAYIKVSELA